MPGPISISVYNDACYPMCGVCYGQDRKNFGSPVLGMGGYTENYDAPPFGTEVRAYHLDVTAVKCLGVTQPGF